VTQPSNSELIRQCRRGSETAWHQLVDRFGRLVYSIPRRYGMNASDADDIVQTVFTILFRRLDRLEESERLGAWLITTTQRECWRQMRQSRDAASRATDLEGRSDPFDAASADGPTSRSPEDEARLWEEQHLIRRAMNELGGRCEELLTALFVQGPEQSYEAVARKLNIPVGSVGPTRARCFAKLEKILAELGFEPDQ